MPLRQYRYRYVPSYNEQRNTIITVNLANFTATGVVVTVT